MKPSIEKFCDSNYLFTGIKNGYRVEVTIGLLRLFKEQSISF